MAQRIIKNYTDTDTTINDLGELIIPSHGAIDVGGSESRLIELANSDDLLSVLAQGIDKFQLNDGVQDLGFSDGIDVIRRIETKTQRDQLGRWIVRSDSRRKNYDTVFIGCGDDIANNKIGGGPEFRFDFSAPESDPRWIPAPEGFKRQRIDWRFIDTTYIKEGVVYFFNAPKGSYLDFRFLIPNGYPFFKKHVNPINDEPYWDQDLTFTTKDTVIGEWVIKHWVEGSCPMGDYLNTEAAHENPSPSFVTYRFEVTAPISTEIEQFHGHFSVELYRGRTLIWEN
jgi:hypothetical protein